MKHLKQFENINTDDIFYYIKNEDLNKVKELIASGINLEILNIVKWTPLYYAVLFNKDEIVEELINAGANVNFKKNGGTPLIHAAQNNNLQNVKLLIEAGADLNIKNKDNRDFLDYLSNNQKKEIIKSYPEKYEEYLLKKEAENYNI